MNTKLLRRIQKQILKEPKQFDMSWWFSTSPHIPNCGTAACVAGWVMALHRGCSPHQASRLEIVDVSSYAQKLLSITPAQAQRLFHAEYWPRRFRRYSANSPKQAVARIEHFIKTGE